jgi:hypothetical protein
LQYFQFYNLCPLLISRPLFHLLPASFARIEQCLIVEWSGITDWGGRTRWIDVIFLAHLFQVSVSDL